MKLQIITSCLLILLAIIACRQQQSFSPEEEQLRMAVFWLWEQQEEDGGWHSKQHGILRGGQAWTPFVLYSLSLVPEELVPVPQRRREAGLAFIRRHLGANGALGLSDPNVLEYPNYATAYALRVLRLWGDESDQQRIRDMQNYLLSEQFAEPRGIYPNHPAYGAWGFGETTLQNGAVGHVDLSHTRRILQTLANSPGDKADILKRVKSYLHRVQKRTMDGVDPKAAGYDGGFFFSPVVPAANKGGSENGHYRSYATATCDGLLALLASGLKPGNRQVDDAILWLRSHPQLDVAAGIPADDPAQWQSVMFFYHISVRAEVYGALKWPGPWRQEVYHLLSKERRDDGSYVNLLGNLNKEDDPILATAMAIQAMAYCLAK